MDAVFVELRYQVNIRFTLSFAKGNGAERIPASFSLCSCAWNVAMAIPCPYRHSGASCLSYQFEQKRAEARSRIMLAANDRIWHNMAMAMTSMNISLPDELKQYIEAQTKAGYSTPSEYLRELIREDRKRRAQQRLDQLLLEGLNSGESIPADEKFWADLKTEALRSIEARKKSRSKQK